MCSSRLNKSTSRKLFCFLRAQKKNHKCTASLQRAFFCWLLRVLEQGQWFVSPLCQMSAQHSYNITPHSHTENWKPLLLALWSSPPHLPTDAPLGQEQVKDDKPYLLAANQESLQDGTHKRKEVCWAERRTKSSPEIGEGTATLLMARWRHHAASSHSR